MKKTFFLLTALIGASCTETKKDQAALPPANTYTLVFLDKTQSVNPGDSFVKTKYASAIKNLADENIRTEGDRLEVYFIHENTSKARALSISSRTARENTEGLSPTDLEAAANAYDLSIKKERQVIYNALMQKLMESNASASNSETNISAGVPVISAALETNPEVSVWFFSDMVESRRAGRDFHTRAPQTPEQAAAWAKEDAAGYKSHNLSGATVYMILPFSPNSSSKVNNPNVTEYWKTFFGELGATKVMEK
ncbi:hypothetical protein FQZ97_844940 [compost metagenome]